VENSYTQVDDALLERINAVVANISNLEFDDTDATQEERFFFFSFTLSSSILFFILTWSL